MHPIPKLLVIAAAAAAGAAFAQPDPAQASLDRLQQEQARRRDDAAASVRASWKRQTELIKSIIVAYKCDFIDRTSADVSVMRLHAVMVETANRAGVDMQRDLRAATDEASAAATSMVDGGVCPRLSAEWRGNVRRVVASLMR